MPSLVIEGICVDVEERHLRMGDGSEVWVFYRDGRQVFQRVGVDCDFGKLARDAPPGLILEFGVATGKSIKELALARPQDIIYGFDWWGGLPHDWNPADRRRALICKKPSDLPANVELIEGLFGDTLEEFLRDHLGPVGFVHIDSDLYCSCMFVLHCLMDRFVRGSIIAFDDINQGHYGEREAWRRYLQETHQEWDFIGKQHPFGEVYRRE